MNEKAETDNEENEEPKQYWKEEDGEEPILNVSDLAPKRRKIVLASGDLTEVVSPMELGILQRAEVDRHRKELMRLQKKGALTDSQAKELVAVTDKLATIALPALSPKEREGASLLDKEAAIAIFTASFTTMTNRTASAISQMMDEPIETESDDLVKLAIAEMQDD